MIDNSPLLGFQAAIQEVVQKAIEQGFEAPITVVSVSADGGLTAMRCEWADSSQRDLEATIIADYTSDDSGMIRLPLNIIVTDAQGLIRRLSVHSDKPRTVH